MQITETNVDGLKHEFKVVISATDIEEKIALRLEEVGRTVKLPGFRPGKVPMKLLRQRYGQSLRGEILEQAVNDTSAQALQERNLRPALQPKIEIDSAEEGKDLEYSISVEVLPDIEPMDFAGVSLERLTVSVDDARVDEMVERLADSRRPSEPITDDRGAETGDIVVLDFDGTVDGEAKPGMKGEDHQLELGSNSFVGTFEEQLVGAKPGDQRTVTVTFPEGYASEELSGKEAVFECTIKELRSKGELTIDDALASEFGFESLEAMRDVVRERVGKDYADSARTKLKRELLDQLAAAHDFPVPSSMVDLEFDAIWGQVQQAIDNDDLSEEDKAKPEDVLKDEYRAIAERRVRLGLLLSEVGRRNSLEVSQEEMNQALMGELRKYPGQENQVVEFYQKNPRAIEQLRAPLMEDKVVDFILEIAKIEDRTVTADELQKLVEESEKASESALA